MKVIRVLIADDHPILREGVSALLQVQSDMELVGEASNGAEAVEAFRLLKPDVILMDLQMPVLNGLNATSTILRECNSARIIVFTTYSGDAQALRALRTGAAGFLLKSALRRELPDAIRLVYTGRRHIPKAMAAELGDLSGEDSLSEREAQVLTLVADGHANRSIGDRLSISEETVKTHLKSIFSKLRVNDRTHAVAVAIRRGMISL